MFQLKDIQYLERLENIKDNKMFLNSSSERSREEFKKKTAEIFNSGQTGTN